MPARRTLSLALAALLAALAASGCGPGTPSPPTTPTTGAPTGGSGGGTGGGGSGGGGSGDGSGGTTSGGGSGGGSGGTTSGGTTGGSGGSGSATPGVGAAFVSVLGGAGDEWAQDVAAAPGGAVIALTLVGPHDGGVFDQLGLTRIDGGGAKPGRLYDIGAPLAFPRDGALSTGPGGEVYLALQAQCGSSGCKGLGTAVNGSALVQLDPSSGDPRWVARLSGTVASQPVVDPPGNVAVATSEGGANVVRSYTPAGAPRWQVSLPGGAQDDVFLAADAGANVIAARGSDVTKIAPDGTTAWTRTVAAQISGVAGTATGAVVVAGTTSSGAAILELGPDGSDRSVRALPGPADDVRVEVGGGKRIGAVTGAGGCGATVTALDVGGGAPLWSRPVATAGCDGSQLRVNGVTVTTGGVVVVAGALSGTVDLGTGPLSSKGTDAILAGFGP